MVKIHDDTFHPKCLLCRKVFVDHEEQTEHVKEVHPELVPVHLLQPQQTVPLPPLGPPLHLLPASQPLTKMQKGKRKK
jgi:hypothetical protein